MGMSESDATYCFRPLIDRMGGHLKLIEPLGLKSSAHAKRMYEDDRVPGHFGKKFVSLARSVGKETKDIDLCLFDSDMFLRLLERRNAQKGELTHG